MKRENYLRGQARVSSTAGAESLSLRDRLRAWHNSCDGGQSIVEFALMLPALLAVLLAIFGIGIFLINYETLTQAVNQGGMALQAGEGWSGNDPCATVSTAVTGVTGNLQTAGANGVQLQVKIGSYTSTFQPAATFSCVAGASYASAGVSATVTGTYPCMPFTVNGVKFFASGCTMKATVQELMQ